MPHSQNNKTVSIIIPVHNAERYIQECLDSVLHQSYANLEIILINDGSTDQSAEIIKEYSDARLQLINTPNKGVSAARNTGIKQSTGTYLFFLDADDRLPTAAIQQLVNGIEKGKSEICIGAYRQFEEKTTIRTVTIFPESTTLDRQQSLNYITAYLENPNQHPLFVFSWGRIFLASAVKKNNLNFEESLNTFEDVLFNFQVLKNIEKVSYTTAPVYEHRLHSLNQSATTSWATSPDELFDFKHAVFEAKALLSQSLPESQLNNLVNQCLCSYSIVQLIRICGAMNSSSFGAIYRYIKELVHTDWLSLALRDYKVAKGHSKLIPWCLKHKYTLLVVIACYYKAIKRYKLGK